MGIEIHGSPEDSGSKRVPGAIYGDILRWSSHGLSPNKITIRAQLGHESGPCNRREVKSIGGMWIKIHGSPEGSGEIYVPGIVYRDTLARIR